MRLDLTWNLKERKGPDFGDRSPAAATGQVRPGAAGEGGRGCQEGRGGEFCRLVGLLLVLLVAGLQFAMPSWTQMPASQNMEGGDWQRADVAPQEAGSLHYALYRQSSRADGHVQPVAGGQWHALGRWAALGPQAGPQAEAIRRLSPVSGRGSGIAPGSPSHRLQVQYTPVQGRSWRRGGGNVWSSDNRTVVPPVYGSRRQGSGNVWRGGAAGEVPATHHRQDDGAPAAPSYGTSQWPRDAGAATGMERGRANAAAGQYTDQAPRYTGTTERAYPPRAATAGRGEPAGAPVFGDYPPLDEPDRTTGGRPGTQRERAYERRRAGRDVRHGAPGASGAYAPDWAYSPYLAPLPPLPPAPLPW